MFARLYRDIGPDVDVLDGDLGCGPREIGFMFGQYKRLSNRFAGAFTGKGEGWGGSAMRTEATGFGVVYFAEHMLNARGESLAGTRAQRQGYRAWRLPRPRTDHCSQPMRAQGRRCVCRGRGKWAAAPC